MARPVRVEFTGAVYHVMARGNERKAIYRDDRDRQRFVETLAEMVERFGVFLHVYCLMPNHYHLLVETPRGNLSQAIGWLQVTYTVRFNRRHRRSGHLFQGRFKAQLVEADTYAQGLVEYVHLNPVRPRCKGERIAAQREPELDAYRWSSHRVYAGLERKPPEWLCQQWLRYWGGSTAEARREYRRHVRWWFDRVVKSPWGELIGGLVLGGERLLAKANAQLGQRTTADERHWIQQRHRADVRKRLGAALVGERDERIKIWARIQLGGESGASLAREYGYRDGSGVGQLVRRLERRRAHDPALREKLTRITTNVSRVQS